jgi:hypothetical protein
MTAATGLGPALFDIVNLADAHRGRALARGMISHAAAHKTGPRTKVKRVRVCCIFPANAAGAAMQRDWIPSTVQRWLGTSKGTVSFCRQNARLYFTCY